jgi:hypothetical protein
LGIVEFFPEGLMGSTSARRIFIGLVAAGALTAGAAAGADSAQASTTRTCQPAPQAPLVNNLCVTVVNGQVWGDFLYIGTGTLTVDDILLAACNAANTSCSEVPGSHATSQRTPALPAAPGQNYKTCIFFHIRFSTLDNRGYSGCSPLATAPAGIR